jgi:hypothetical protein
LIHAGIQFLIQQHMKPPEVDKDYTKVHPDLGSLMSTSGSLFKSHTLPENFWCISCLCFTGSLLPLKSLQSLHEFLEILEDPHAKDRFVRKNDCVLLIQ